MILIQQPDEINNILWAGRLIPSDDTADAENDRFINDDNTGNWIHKLPTITIGVPEIWPLNDICSTQNLSKDTELYFHKKNFYLIRFVCSFSPKESNYIEIARFVVNFEKNNVNDEMILVYDLHPQAVFTEIKRNVRVTIGSTFKFLELSELSGGIEWGTEYRELQPVISAAGAMTSIASWDYRKSEQIPVLGIKWMHLIVMVPKEIQSLNACIGLAGVIRSKGSLLNVIIPKKYVESTLKFKFF